MCIRDREVIRKVRRLGYVDDERAARGWARSMRQRGKATVAIRAALRQRGVGPEIVSMVLAEGPSDLEGARRFARRRKLGPHRPEGERRSNRQKDLAKLARAGFSYEIAVRVLDDEEALTLED